MHTRAGCDSDGGEMLDKLGNGTKEKNVGSMPGKRAVSVTRAENIMPPMPMVMPKQPSLLWTTYATIMNNTDQNTKSAMTLIMVIFAINSPVNLGEAL
jgi:hypothetical protein